MPVLQDWRPQVGMLYEQGSSRGLVLTRPDGTVRTLADAAANQYVAFEAALKLAARERTRLLRDYAAGTGVVYAGQAEDNVHADVGKVAERFALDDRAVDSGLGEG
ncbi:MAG: hypothetical protein JJU22_03430, partial [Gammaproteobacteria bacterium]|nr:hypothetical protein [Gammaproteobacteria bacterium]